MQQYEKFSDDPDGDRDSVPKLDVTCEQVNVDMSSSMNGTSLSTVSDQLSSEPGSSTNGNRVRFEEVEGQKSYEDFPSYDSSSLTFREKLRHFVQHLYFRAFSLILIIIDCILVIVDISTSDKSAHEQNVFDALAMLFVVYFVLELGLRIYSQGYQLFMSKWYNLVDSFVIALSFLITTLYMAIDLNTLAKITIFGRLLRAIVLIRFIRLLSSEPRNLQKGIRHAVSENKRRLQTDEFDLDMTYICKNVIGMSFPSSGKMALYRNNIKDVAKYLDTKHGIGHYKVYNLCSERDYDSTYFHGSVARYTIDDHNVPSLEQMLEFTNDVRSFLEEDKDRNVIAVHCKGGKGRTGTMICAWLIANGAYKSSEEALKVFADQRTDKTFSSKYQGVETPSQGRYVDYFSQIINELNGQIPGKRPLQLKEMKIYALIGVGAGDGSDLTCSVYIDRSETFEMDFGECTNCEVEYAAEADILTVKPINCPQLVGNVRLKFNSKLRAVPRAYEDCAWYFWFNTSFVDAFERRLRIKREQLDNPHKSKTWKIYREKFAVELIFN